MRREWLRTLATRLRMRSLPDDSHLRAALCLQLAWRRHCDRVAKESDPLYRLIARDREGDGGHMLRSAKSFVLRHNSSSAKSFVLQRNSSRTNVHEPRQSTIDTVPRPPSALSTGSHPGARTGDGPGKPASNARVLSAALAVPPDRSTELPSLALDAWRGDMQVMLGEFIEMMARHPSGSISSTPKATPPQSQRRGPAGRSRYPLFPDAQKRSSGQ